MIRKWADMTINPMVCLSYCGVGIEARLTMDAKESGTIRAVFRGGLIYPLESVPPQWVEGQELRVEEAQTGMHWSTEAFDKWCKEMVQLTASLDNDGVAKVTSKIKLDPDAGPNRR